MAIVQVTPELVAAALATTDWQKLDAQTDEDIARQVADDPDAAPILTGSETASAITRTVRMRLGLSQVEFAARFHLPVGTLRDWEQNRRTPDAPAVAYLRVIAREPDGGKGIDDRVGACTEAGRAMTGDDEHYVYAITLSDTLPSPAKIRPLSVS